MALATQGQQPFSSQDCKVFPFASGVPGTGIDVPGFQTVTSDPQTTTAQNRGDDAVIAAVATIDSLDLAITVGIWNLDAIAAMVGGAVETTGATPNQIRSITHKSTDQPADSAIICQAASRSPDGGATQIIFPRCQPQNVPGYGLADQDFNNLEIDMSAIPDASGRLVVVYQYETTPATISTTFPTLT
jgi:hypothetical protein